MTLFKSYISNFAPLIYAIKVGKPLRIAFDMKKSSSHPPLRVTVCEAVVTRHGPIILICSNSINSACNYNNSSNTNFHCTIFSRLNVPGVYFKLDSRSRRLLIRANRLLEFLLIIFRALIYLTIIPKAYYNPNINSLRVLFINLRGRPGVYLRSAFN